MSVGADYKAFARLTKRVANETNKKKANLVKSILEVTTPRHYPSPTHPGGAGADRWKVLPIPTGWLISTDAWWLTFVNYGTKYIRPRYFLQLAMYEASEAYGYQR